MKIEVNIEKKHFYFITGLIVLMFGFFVVNASYENGMFHYLSDIVDANGQAISSDGNKINSEFLNINTAEFQKRVSQSCPENQSIRQVNEDGSVVCEEDSGISSVNWSDIENIPSGFADEVDNIGLACNWASGTWKCSDYVTTASGVTCNNGNSLCSWKVRTCLYCSNGVITNIKMDSSKSQIGH